MTLQAATSVIAGRSSPEPDYNRIERIMTISVELDDEQSRRLLEIARELHVEPTELAKAAINDLTSRTADDFERASKHVLEKNRELYRRLS